MMTNYPMIKLKDCCSIVSGATPRREVEDYWGGDICWVTPKDLSKLEDLYLNNTPEKITKKGFDSCSAPLLPVGSVLFSSRAPIGHIAIVGTPMCTNQGFKSLIPGQSIDSTYLYFCLLWMKRRIQDLGNGATFKEVSKEVVGNVQIPLPPLETQKQIAAVLEKADQLRKDCQRVEEELNTLAQSMFFEMFGDPVTNSCGWEHVKLSEVIERIESGWSPKCKDEPASDSEWGILKLGSVTGCYYKDTKNKALLEGVVEKQNIEVKEGDLLFSRKNTYEHVAASAYVRRTRSQLLLPDLIFRLVPKEEIYISKVFLWALFVNKNFRKKIQQLANGAAGSMPNISKSTLLAFEIPLPPFEMQEKYERIMKNIWLQKDTLENKKQYFDDLFNSLLQKAFKGELDLKGMSKAA